MLEAAFAIPVLMLLFAGCVQLLQVGIAHIVVMEAAYEAGRQAVMDQGNPGPAGFPCGLALARGLPLRAGKAAR